jgi:hypothetical protein
MAWLFRWAAFPCDGSSFRTECEMTSWCGRFCLCSCLCQPFRHFRGNVSKILVKRTYVFESICKMWCYSHQTSQTLVVKTFTSCRISPWDVLDTRKTESDDKCIDWWMKVQNRNFSRTDVPRMVEWEVKWKFWKDPDLHTQSCMNPVLRQSDEELEKLIRYAALMHNLVMTAPLALTEQWETSCLVNDAFGTTSWLFQDVSDVTFIVFHRVVRQHHLLR